MPVDCTRFERILRRNNDNKRLHMCMMYILTVGEVNWMGFVWVDSIYLLCGLVWLSSALGFFSLSRSWSCLLRDDKQAKRVSRFLGEATVRETQTRSVRVARL